MLSFYIPHKIKIGDITKLSDQDSIFAISNNILINKKVRVENNENIYHAKVVKISKNSIDVLIEDIIHHNRNNEYEIILLQSLIQTHKYKYVLEKSIEIGVNTIQPIYSEYSTESIKKISKMNNIWRNTIKDAKKQSRNRNEIKYNNPVDISNLKNIINTNSIKLCMSTENIKKNELNQLSKNIQNNKTIYIAIGPERGWSVDDIEIFKQLNFSFIQLKGNILRAETASLVILSIIKYIKDYK